jgi:hypothetical protein
MVVGPSTTDRLDGVNEGIAKKAPVRVRTTANITLSGEQTIDGVAAVEGDRVLVMVQTDATENGIYNVSTGVWERSLDCNGNRDLVTGSMVFVNEGTTWADTLWQCTTSPNPIVFDTDDITWVQWSGGGGFPNATYVTVDVEFGNGLPNSYQLLGGNGIDLTEIFIEGVTQSISVDASAHLRTSTLNLIINGNGATISTGIKLDVQLHAAYTIQSVTLLADQSGSVVVDIWKDTYANYPPTDADSITSATPPTISSATKSTDATLASWVTAIAAGDTLRFNIDSITSIQRLTISLKLLKGTS